MFIEIFSPGIFKITMILVGGILLYYLIVYFIFGSDVFNLKKQDIEKEEEEKENEKKEKNNSFIKILNKKNKNIENFTILAKNNKAQNRLPEIDDDDISEEIEIECEGNPDSTSYMADEIDFFDVNSALKQFKEKESEENYNDSLSNILDEFDIKSPDMDDDD